MESTEWKLCPKRQVKNKGLDTYSILLMVSSPKLLGIAVKKDNRALEDLTLQVKVDKV